MTSAKKKARSKVTKSSTKGKGVTQPPAASRGVTQKTNGARATPARNGGTAVSRKEYVCSLTSTGAAFELLGDSASIPGYDFNPAASRMFPWLSRIAPSWERYRFVNNVTFHLIPGNPSTSSGRVFMSADLDWDDPVPATKAEALQSRFAVEGGVWNPLSLTIPASDLMRGMPWRYVQHPTRSDPEPRTVFAGFLVIGATSATAGNTWDLWVTYNVDLDVVQLSDQAPIFRGLDPTTGEPTDVAAYATGIGGTNAALVPPQVFSGPDPTSFKEVSLEPIPASYASADTPPQRALDLSQLAMQGLRTLSTIMGVSKAGSAPSSILGSHSPTLEHALFASNGNFLGVVSELLGGGGAYPKMSGVPNAASQLVGDPAYATEEVDLFKLASMAPNARWIVPFFTALVSSFSAASGQFGYRLGY